MQSEYEQTKTTRCLHVLITTHSNSMFTLCQCQCPPLPTDPNFLSNTGFLRSLSFKKPVTRSKEVFLFAAFYNSQDVLNFLKVNNYIGSGCKQFQNDQTVQSEYEQTKTTRCLHVLITTHSNSMFTLCQCQCPPLPTDPNFLSNTGFLRSLSFKKPVTRSKEVFLFAAFYNSQDVLNFLKVNNYIGSGCKQFQNDQTVQSEYEQTKTPGGGGTP